MWLDARGEIAMSKLLVVFQLVVAAAIGAMLMTAPLRAEDAAPVPDEWQAVITGQIQAFRDHDPDAALSFLYSSKPPANPTEDRRYSRSQEGLLELAIANQISKTDPTRALQIARQSLKTHYSTNLVGTVGLLRVKNPELAAQFASEIASKLLNEKLLTNPEAASVAINLLRQYIKRAKSCQYHRLGCLNS